MKPKKNKTQKIGVDRFKELIRYMYSLYPNAIYFERVEKVVITQKMRDHLVKQGILVEESYSDENGKKKVGYSLGANALSLVNAWSNEKLTMETRNLTKRIYWLTAFLLILTLVLVIHAIALY